MVNQALILLKTVFENCVLWFGQLLAAVDGAGVLIAAFIIVLTVSLFLMPLRGGGITVDGFRDFTSQATYSASYRYGGKYAASQKVSANRNYKGKYAKRPHGGHRAVRKG